MGYVTIYSLGSMHSSFATQNTYLHVRLWTLWSTIDFMPIAIVSIYWVLISEAFSATEAT